MAWKGTRPSAFGKKIPAEVGKRTRAAAMQALSGVIERSPVGNPDLWQRPAPEGYVGGAFRGNNVVSVSAPDYSADESAIDPDGQRALAMGSAVIAATRGAPFTVIYVQNNLPYAERLESGYSGQAPAGVYAITFSNLREASR
ncbi:hypothetical protein [uncultured Halomonas sp.]|uniref:hypothetical protein n=1 Tax=uncultured Halomonas sp. TaxID=173971 RepID=UPI00263A0EC5|nr:hypothetical protein [uncultured Halomonas sp.]